MSALYSPTFPHQRNRAPPHTPIIHRQGKLHAAPRHCTSLHAAVGMFFLRFAKPFLPALTLFSFSIELIGEGGGGDSRREGGGGGGGKV